MHKKQGLLVGSSAKISMDILFGWVEHKKLKILFSLSLSLSFKKDSLYED